METTSAKPKRQLTEAQLAALQRGRQRLAEKRQAKQTGNTMVVEEVGEPKETPVQHIESPNDSEDYYEGGFCTIT